MTETPNPSQPGLQVARIEQGLAVAEGFEALKEFLMAKKRLHRATVRLRAANRQVAALKAGDAHV